MSIRSDLPHRLRARPGSKRWLSAMSIAFIVAAGALATPARAARPSRLSEVAGVDQAAFSADGAQVVIGTKDDTISLWNASNGSPIAGEINGPGQAFVTSADGRSILVSLPAGGARIFATDTGAARFPALDVRLRVPAHPEVVFSPDAARVLVFEPGAAAVFDTGTGRRLATLPLGKPAAEEEDLDLAPSAVFSKNGLQCVVMTASGVVTRYDATTWKPSGPPLLHPAAESAYTYGFAVSDDVRWLATFDGPGENGPKGHLQVWDVAKGKPLAKPIVAINGLRGEFLPGAGTSPSAFARLLVTPGRGEAFIRDLPTLKKSCTIPAHDDVDGPSVALSPDRKWVLSWGADRIVRLQNAATGAVQESQAFQATISQVLMLPDSTGCLVAFDNSAFLLRDYYDHYVLKLSFPDLQTTHSLRLTEPLNRAVLSPDGRRLLLQAGKTDVEHVLLYDVADFKPLAP